LEGICGVSNKSVRFADITLAARRGSGLLSTSCDGSVNGRPGVDTRSKGRKVTCDDCFFGKNGLCALGLDQPCATFRPNSPEGLRPPSQMRFVFRQERRRQAAWQFPTAQEQAALHA
jgi:hypothetical protein